MIYYTEIDIEKCKKRIDAIIMSEKYLSSGLRGAVDFYGNTFNIRKNKANFHSAFARYFQGELIRKENGTIIQGEFCMNFAVVMFLTIWFGFLAFIWVSSLIFYLANNFFGMSIEYSGIGAGLMGPPLMALFGGGLIGASSELYENEENYVLEFIKDMLEAKKIEK